MKDDGQIQNNLSGSSRKGEQDTLHVCRLLVEKLNRDGATWNVPQLLDDVNDVDCEATDMNASSVHLQIQVTRAICDPGFWSALANQRELSLQVSPGIAAAQLRQAIEKKESIPPRHRGQLVLALDANRLPAHSFNTVVAEFKKANLQWAQQLGFREIWIVGPVTDLVRRLDR